jgi:hypothetical protein
MVNGNFEWISHLGGGRFLQKSLKTNEYFALKDQYTIGVFNAKTYKFTKLLTSEIFIYNSDYMWIDEEKNIVYVVLDGDLLEILLSND